MPMKIEGLELFLDKLTPRAVSEAKRNVAVELYQFGEEVMSASKAVVPVDTGALMNTGQVSKPTEADGVVEVTVGYGDESVGYAIYVHEELDAPSGGPIHYTRPGSGSKYLERPATALAPQLPDRVKRGIMNTFSD